MFAGDGCATKKLHCPLSLFIFRKYISTEKTNTYSCILCASGPFIILTLYLEIPHTMEQIEIQIWRAILILSRTFNSLSS